MLFNNFSGRGAIDVRVHCRTGEDVDGWAVVAPVATTGCQHIHFSAQPGVVDQLVETGEGGRAVSSGAVRPAANMDAISCSWLIWREKGFSFR